MKNNSSGLIDKKENQVALIVSLIAYLLLYNLGRDFTISWQGIQWTIDKTIVWFCSVMPALAVAVALYISIANSKLKVHTVFTMVITYIVSYIMAFIVMFFACLILMIFEELTIGVLLIALLPFCGAVQTTVIIIIF